MKLSSLRLAFILLAVAAFAPRVRAEYASVQAACAGLSETHDGVADPGNGDSFVLGQTETTAKALRPAAVPFSPDRFLDGCRGHAPQRPVPAPAAAGVASSARGRAPPATR